MGVAATGGIEGSMRRDEGEEEVVLCGDVI
jgi:hypothetical protein